MFFVFLLSFLLLISFQALYLRVEALDKDPSIHGIIVQLPLPSHINERVILDVISLPKDVDGFHPANIGALAMKGRTPLAVPCTPKGSLFHRVILITIVLFDNDIGCIEMLERLKIPIAGKHAVVVGRSNIVGVPASLLLLHRYVHIIMLFSFSFFLLHLICDQ